ncbi:cupin domain-containing protein [Bradyrhizobium sp. LHD-71]|uniref:cupin domain-containing protein n=1 Tax=Bradyrhizobium sp. LHD-71 TaxID=3072141 RepID=UPI002810212D|nr:cupin domain-containing protein [Bradyrhizobium sp. LHD-71]MDQ8728298.1 cupin domain-containing protein [Bradyrhizobium sp. LHD-71]
MTTKKRNAPPLRGGWTRERDFLDISSELGAKLRELRQTAGISLKQAQDLTGVPHATLSRIETNKMAPTLPLLAKVVAGLGVPWSAVLPQSIVSDAPSGPEVSFSSDQASGIRLGRREIISLHPDNPLTGRIEPFIMSTRHRTLEQAGGLLGHPHTEFCFVLEGKLRLHLQGRRARVLHPGESALFDSTIPHAYTSASEGSAQFLIVAVPPTTVIGTRKAVDVVSQRRSNTTRFRRSETHQT